ncbi:transcription antitermination protein NusB [Mycoplasmatota bacterium]|nr:transcription antitermination protein NusB [Mycoplasmatota bacterium]
MKKETRKQRETIIFNLYQHEIYLAINKTYESLIEDDETYKIFEDILSHLSDLDDVIESQLFNYSLNRLSYVDRAIIRFATYELMYTKTPVEIILNEAVEITKEFTTLDDEKQRKFSNKLLDNIAHAIRD